MTGAWRDYLKRVIKMDESEIELMQRIAQMVPGYHCRCIIQMMIQKEKEEMQTLRVLLGMDEREPCKEPCKPWPPCPPEYGDDYDPGRDPNYDFPCDPMPYTEDDREEK